MRNEKDYLRLIALQGIEDHCKWIADSCERLVHYANILASRPPYETMAEAEITRALWLTQSALAKLNDIQKIYAEKKVEE